MNRALIILRKEWSEVFRNRLVLMTTLFLPVSFLSLGLISLWAAGQAVAGGEVPLDELQALPATVKEVCVGLDAGGCLEATLGVVYLLLFLILPVVIPNSIASYSVVGEKVGRTLEPLLATPLETWELLAGKALAAVIPAVAATWSCALLYYVGASFLLPGPVFAVLTAPHWFVALGVLGPLLSFTAVLIALMISSLVREPRTAEALAGTVSLPILLAMLGQLGGLVLLDLWLVLALCGFFLVLDGALAALAVWVFDRDTVLTRWR